MINLCSNIFVTYAHTKQFYYRTDGIIVSQVRLNHIVSADSLVLKQVKTLDELFSDSMQFFDTLINRIKNDESHRIVIYLDPAAFQVFITKWLCSAFRYANLDILKEIIKKHADLELARSGGLRFEDPEGEPVDYESIHDLYWNIDPALIEDVHTKGSYYDVNLVFSERGYEHIIGNALLGDPESISTISGKLPDIRKMAVIREFDKVKFLFSERIIQLSHLNSAIGNAIKLGSDFYTEILGMNTSYSKLLSRFEDKNKTTVFDEEMEGTITLVADLFADINPKEVPLCTYVKENSKLPSVDVLLADILGDDEYELLYYYFGNNRYNPAWAEFIRTKMNSTSKGAYLAFGPAVY
jgi:hypothetical protein